MAYVTNTAQIIVNKKGVNTSPVEYTALPKVFFVIIRASPALILIGADTNLVLIVTANIAE